MGVIDPAWIDHSIGVRPPADVCEVSVFLQVPTQHRALGLVVVHLADEGIEHKGHEHVESCRAACGECAWCWCTFSSACVLFCCSIIVWRLAFIASCCLSGDGRDFLDSVRTKAGSSMSISYVL